MIYAKLEIGIKTFHLFLSKQTDARDREIDNSTMVPVYAFVSVIQIQQYGRK